MSRGPFRNSRFHHPHAPSSKRKACKIYWFSLGFKHIAKFEAISTKPPLTAPQPQALFNNSPRKINVFLAEIYWCFRDYEQRHRRRATHFARATPPQTECMFCWNHERHWGLTVCFCWCEIWIWREHMALHFRMINWRRSRGPKKKTKTAAYVWQRLYRPSVSPQTCDKSFLGFLEVNFDER